MLAIMLLLLQISGRNPWWLEPMLEEELLSSLQILDRTRN
jgi:hypothetical protein